MARTDSGVCRLLKNKGVCGTDSDSVLHIVLQRSASGSVEGQTAEFQPLAGAHRDRAGAGAELKIDMLKGGRFAHPQSSLQQQLYQGDIALGLAMGRSGGGAQEHQHLAALERSRLLPPCLAQVVQVLGGVLRGVGALLQPAIKQPQRLQAAIDRGRAVGFLLQQVFPEGR